MAEKKSFLLYISDSPMWKLLNDEQAGVLIKALLQYAETGERIETSDGMVMMAFMTLTAQMDRDAEKYEQKCERRREAGKKGGRPKKQEVSEDEEEETEKSKEKQTKAKKANGFSEKQTKAKKPDAEEDEEEDADAEADAEEDEDAEEEVRFPDASHHGGNARTRANPGAGRAERIFESLWEQYPAEGQTRRDFVPDSCVQDCAEHAEEVSAAIAHYTAYIAANGKKLMSGCDFFRGAWRGFSDAAPPGMQKPSPAPDGREIVQSFGSFSSEDLEALVNQF